MKSDQLRRANVYGGVEHVSMGSAALPIPRDRVPALPNVFGTPHYANMYDIVQPNFARRPH